jgi:sugar-phosphatase
MPHSYSALCFDLFGTLVSDEGVALPGAQAALELRPPTAVAIVTSAPLRLAKLLIERAGLRAPALMVTADDVERTKPAPDPYALAVRRLGVGAAHALAIEDSASGVLAARGAGLDVAYLLRGRAMSSAPAADYYLATLEELRSLI